MQETTDSNLLKWWAQYIESTGDMDEAYKVYQKAEDWFSQVTIFRNLLTNTTFNTDSNHLGSNSVFSR